MLVSLTIILSVRIVAQEKPQNITTQITTKYDSTVQLQIEISYDKSIVAINELVAFDVRIFNLPVNGKREDISIFNPLKLGTVGGLTITVIGPKGNEMFTKEARDQAVQPVIDDSWPYFILRAYHSLGVIYKDSAKNIFQVPGKYFVFAEYLSPVTEIDMKKHGIPQNFWGRELGTIRSAPLEINVTE